MTKGFEMAVVLSAAAIFLVSAAAILCRESAFVYLKTGIELYRKGDTNAVPLLLKGVKRNPDSYLLRDYLAKAEHVTAYRGGHTTPEGKRLVLDARLHLLAALDVRNDSFGHLALAENYQMSGEADKAYAEYNISFFLSLNPEETKRWNVPQGGAEGAARRYFESGDTGTALAIVYNALTGYAIAEKLAAASREPGARLVESYFRDTPPQRWFKAGGEKHKKEAAEILKRAFASMNAEEKKTAVDALAAKKFDFLMEAVSGDGI